MSNKTHYEQLIQRYLDGKATQEELNVFFHLLEEGKLDEYLQQFDLEGTSIDRPRKIYHFPKWQYAAAACLIIVLAATFFLTSQRNSKAQAAAQLALASNSPAALPGTKRATLTLSNGQTIGLGNGRKEIADKNASITQVNDILTYSPEHAGTEVVYNTITTPRGAEFQVTLPDGSRVWINAGSSLHYPTAFTGSERRVILTGEAYFEVAKNKAKPFIVEADGAEVQVLGTHFNVKAYDDDGFMKTTLAEGSVRLSKNGEQKMLKPGEGGIIQHSAEVITVNEANVAEDLAWKDGYFQFDKTAFATIMKQVSRWYDIDVQYKDGHIPDGRFVGRISRYSNLSDVLQLFRLSGIKFSQKNKLLVIEE